MSDMITIPTPFQDVGELAQGFVSRVNEAQLLLPSEDPVAEGETTQFVVLLADGTAAFGGQAQCVQVSDRGEDVPSEEPRYELLLEALEMEEASQAVFDHLVAVREAAYAAQDEPAQPDASEDAAYADVEATEAEAAREPDTEDWQAIAQEPGTEDIQEIHEDTLQDVTEQPAEDMSEAATAEPGLEQVPQELEHVEALSESIQPEQVQEEIAPPQPLTRPVFQATALPQPPPRPEPRPSSGLFVFQGEGLPVPPGPPRPQLDPSLAVAPAPRPNGAAHASAAAAGSAFEPAETLAEPTGAPAETREAATDLEETPEEPAEASAEPDAQKAPDAPQDVEDLDDAELMSVPPDTEISAAEEEAPADDAQQAESPEEELQLEEDEPQQPS